MATEDPLPTQLRGLATLVERLEDATDAEVQSAQPAGVSPDGEMLRADLTVVAPTDALEATTTDAAADSDAGEPPARDEAVADDTPDTDTTTDADGTDAEPALSELTDTVRKDVLAVAKRGQPIDARAADRDVTTAAIKHNLRVAREELGVDDLEAYFASQLKPAADDTAETGPDTDSEGESGVEWAQPDGGVAAFSASARVVCQNCGNDVSEQYARVFSPDGESVRCCPACPDKVREHDGSVREARSSRSGARLLKEGET